MQTQGTVRKMLLAQTRGSKYLQRVAGWAAFAGDNICSTPSISPSDGAPSGDNWLS
jgi:hypothetical protein